ncbi:hypothetical protein CEXT_661261 [Caerostris extrusa]|uniref:Uncharacterized protein n=1 Tax=Caerostris extrusa TaxID=172846 RepID=A0AAV4XPP6_CAEEX|nr:hypothetical protein CEXT_661261 [Caerostris extrusa]
MGSCTRFRFGKLKSYQPSGLVKMFLERIMASSEEDIIDEDAWFCLPVFFSEKSGEKRKERKEQNRKEMLHQAFALVRPMNSFIDSQAVFSREQTLYFS